LAWPIQLVRLRLRLGSPDLPQLASQSVLLIKKKEKSEATISLSTLFGRLLFVASDSTVGTPKKIAHAAFPLRFHHLPPLLLLCSRRHHGFFINFFRLRSNLAMFGAFRWHQLSRLGSSHTSAHTWSLTLGFSHERASMPVSPLSSC
jgi:hypothetical protein